MPPVNVRLLPPHDLRPVDAEGLVAVEAHFENLGFDEDLARLQIHLLEQRGNALHVGRLVFDDDQVALEQRGDLAVARDVLGEDVGHGLGVGILDLEGAQHAVARQPVEAGVLAFDDLEGVAAALGDVAAGLGNGPHGVFGAHVVEVHRDVAGDALAHQHIDFFVAREHFEHIVDRHFTQIHADAARAGRLAGKRGGQAGAEQGKGQQGCGGTLADHGLGSWGRRMSRMTRRPSFSKTAW